MSIVPLIDISALYGDDTAARTELAAELDHACREIGFFQIVGHGVDEEIVRNAYRTAREFFELPLRDKRLVAQPSPETVRGYSAVGEENFAYGQDLDAPGDLHEKFDTGPVDVPPGDPYYGRELAGQHFTANQWPVKPAGMQQAWEAYFRVFNHLSRTLMKGLALALELPEDFFERAIDRDISMLRAINYPDQLEAPAPGQLRAAAHSDYGSITIVRQEEAPGGLEVLTQHGDWVPVPVIPGAFVVNLGDLMAQWTNDRYLSTRHRVVNPPLDKAHDSRRMSLVFFHQPNYDALIECLPTVLTPGEVPRYEPVTSGDHLQNKFTKSHAVGPVNA